MFAIIVLFKISFVYTKRCSNITLHLQKSYLNVLNNSILSTKIRVYSQLIGLTTIQLAGYIEATTKTSPKALIISKPRGDNKDNCNL